MIVFIKEWESEFKKIYLMSLIDRNGGRNKIRKRICPCLYIKLKD